MINQEMDEMNDRRKENDEHNKKVQKAAVEMLEQCGRTYVEIRPPDFFEKDIRATKAEIIAWNQILKGSVPYNLNTIEVMLFIMAKIPIVAGADILTRNGYNDLNAMLSAIRNRLKEERDKRINESSPGLSPNIDN